MGKIQDSTSGHDGSKCKKGHTYIKYGLKSNGNPYWICRICGRNIDS
jgi:hypothetical protein